MPLRIRDKAEIIELNITQEQRDEIERQSWRIRKSEVIRKILGANVCVSCGGVPSIVVLSEVGFESKTY
jgi:hypothetical protein